MKWSTCEALQTGMHVQSSHLHQPVYCGYFLPCWVLRTTNVAWTGHLASSAPVFSVSSAIQPNFVEPYTANQKNLMSAKKWYLFGIQDWPWGYNLQKAQILFPEAKNQKTWGKGEAQGIVGKWMEMMKTCWKQRYSLAILGANFQQILLWTMSI